MPAGTSTVPAGIRGQFACGEPMMKSISKIAHCRSALLASAVALACAQSALADSVYMQHNLVFDGTATNFTADHADGNLVNAWGVAFGPGSPIWVANNGSSTSTVYDGDGNGPFLTVTVTGQDPTGIVWNGSSSFSGAHFIFATESGTIDAWTGGGATTVAQTVPGAVFKGIALSGDGSALKLYATDFANGAVD